MIHYLTVSIIILNVKGLNILIKRQKFLRMLRNKRQDPTICCVQEAYFKLKTQRG